MNSISDLEMQHLPRSPQSTACLERKPGGNTHRTEDGKVGGESGKLVIRLLAGEAEGFSIL
ncbi:hypothetical protein [Paenibacillus lactis]|uniref:hypothetical protein n=1 Tax=Paenibacillus lactis TaxID=228574 RepID=UPI0011A76D52